MRAGFHQEEESTGHLGLRRGIYAEQPLYSTFGKDDRFRTTSSSAEQSPGGPCRLQPVSPVFKVLLSCVEAEGHQSEAGTEKMS